MKANVSFADQLRAELTRLDLTQAAAAEVLEVSPRAVWKWLNDEPPELVVTQEGVIARLKNMKAPKK